MAEWRNDSDRQHSAHGWRRHRRDGVRVHFEHPWRGFEHPRRGGCLGHEADTHRSLTAEINATRLALSDEIEATRLELSAKIEALDARLCVVEKDVAGIQSRLGGRHPVTQDASLSDTEDDADA